MLSKFHLLDSFALEFCQITGWQPQQDGRLYLLEGTFLAMVGNNLLAEPIRSTSSATLQVMSSHAKLGDMEGAEAWFLGKAIGQEFHSDHFIVSFFMSFGLWNHFFYRGSAAWRLPVVSIPRFRVMLDAGFRPERIGMDGWCEACVGQHVMSCM